MAYSKKQPLSRDRSENNKNSSKNRRNQVVHKEGELFLHRNGYGFVSIADMTEDVFIPAHAINYAMHTDIVKIRVKAKGRNLYEGVIENIVTHNVHELFGRLEKVKNQYRVIADDRRVKYCISISKSALSGAQSGDNVLVAIKHYPSANHVMSGKIVQVFGKRGEIITEQGAVIAKHQLRTSFSPEAENYAKLASENINTQGRKDLTFMPFVTIDGESAKDFDDAVALETQADASCKLWVAIADVGHFVKEGSVLDEEAFNRGTSVYFPGKCIPMLPESLSNNACSLQPNRERLVMVAEIHINANGNVIKSLFHEAVIRSKYRMTYTDIAEMIIDKNQDTCKKYADIQPMIGEMTQLAKVLIKKRVQQGSIDFDLPEANFIMKNDNEIADIQRTMRHIGHEMIEHFMILANEVVGTYLMQQKISCIYRIHEKPSPDKLANINTLLNSLAYSYQLPESAGSKQMAMLLKKVKSTPVERLINHQVLRALPQAVYSPDNKGHFGLASSCYCHFTSPIRRYPDLIVHRMLKKSLRTNGKKLKVKFNDIAMSLSRKERVAITAERDMNKLYSVLFMQQHEGKQFSGIISHIAKMGIFVELNQFFVEGLIPIESLDDDFYVFDENKMRIRGKKNNRLFHIGDFVDVLVSDVDILEREISFSIQ